LPTSTSFRPNSLPSASARSVVEFVGCREDQRLLAVDHGLQCTQCLIGLGALGLKVLGLPGQVLALPADIRERLAQQRDRPISEPGYSFDGQLPNSNEACWATCDFSRRR
jgi:hypothetical protein